ncbi:MAG: hypothetical protein R3F59_10680 [Myxococcota bacterium]
MHTFPLWFSLWFSAAALAADPDPIPGGLFDADSLSVAADGTVHALAAPKQARLSKLTNQITLTNDQGEVITRVGGHPVRHVRLDPDGTVTVTPIPGPDGAEWAAELHVLDAALDLDPADQPVVVIRGQVCRPNTPCVDQLWLATPQGEGWVTRPLSTEGMVSGLVLDAGSGGWVAVSHVIAGTFAGFAVWDATGAERPWIPCRSGEPVALVLDGERPKLVYRDGDSLHLADGETDRELATGVRHSADALALPGGGVRYTAYDPNSKRLRSGVVAPGDGTASAAVPVDLPESGWFSALALAGDQPVAAWYYYRNNYNKGVRLGVWDGAQWDRWTQIRSDVDNVGWNVDLAASADGTLALVALDRSHHRVVLRRWGSLAEARAEAVPDAGDWTDRRHTTFFFAYGGGWYQLWGIAASPPSEEDFTFTGADPVTGTYGVRPGLGLEGGFAGKIGPVDLVLEYMRRNDDDPAVKTIEAAEPDGEDRHRVICRCRTASALRSCTWWTFLTRRGRMRDRGGAAVHDGRAAGGAAYVGKQGTPAALPSRSRGRPTCS